MKFALWALVIGLVAMWLMRPKKTSTSKNQATQANQAAAGRSQSPHEVERMVKCSRCGTYVPASEAIAGTHAMFCSEEHRRQQG